MPAEIDGLQFQLGQLTGQLASVTATLTSVQNTLAALDERLRKNETNTTVLTVKMSLLGALSGVVGSVITTVIVRFFAKS